MVLILVDCGLRLGELLNLTIQLLKVTGKTGGRIVRFGKSAAKALLTYLLARNSLNSPNVSLWLTKEGNSLRAYSVETIFRHLSRRTGISVHPHLLRHTFATLWLKNSGDSLMLQRLLGHTTLMMTNRYCQAVGCYDAIEKHKQYSPIDLLDRTLS